MKLLKNTTYFFTVLIFSMCIFFQAYTQNPLKKLEFDKPGQKSLTFTFKYINNLIVLPVLINNSDTLNFILDTGITTTMITELLETDSIILNFAREVKLKGLGVGEPLMGIHSYGNEIRIKSISGQNQDIYVILDNAFQLSARMGIQIHGIIGYTVFSNYIVAINYDSKQITFYRPDRYTYKKKSKYTSLPIEISDTKPYIFINIVDESGQVFPVKLLIDTGASHAIWLDVNSVTGLKIPEGSKEAFLGTGLNGEVYGYQGRMKAAEIGGNVLNDVIVSFPDSASMAVAAGLNGRNGSIGSELLKRFNLIVDYPNRKISLRPNNYFNTAYIQNLSGMEVIAPYPNLKIFVVDGIRKDSPAERCGLMKGDVIQSVNGIRSDKLELSGIYIILQNQPGRKVNISYMRNGELKNTSMKLEKFI